MMLKFRGPIIKYIRYEGEGGSLEVRMLPLKLLFLLNWNRGDRDYLMIITGPFIRSTFAQFSPSPPCSLSEKNHRGCSLLAWPSPSSPTHSSPYGDWWVGWNQFWTIQGGGWVKSLKIYAAPHQQPLTNTRKEQRYTGRDQPRSQGQLISLWYYHRYRRWGTKNQKNAD